MNILIKVVLLNLIVSSSLMAQNLQVIGGSSIARACYHASTAAAMTGSANRQDVENCDKALSHGGLKKRDLVATYVNRGVLHTAMENFSKAIKDYNRALKLDPQVAEAYLNRGNLWFIASNYAAAIADYDRSLELGFAKPQVAFLNRGMVYEATGDFERAQSDYSAALDEHAEWPIAVQKLARVSKKIK